MLKQLLKDGYKRLAESFESATSVSLDRPTIHWRTRTGSPRTYYTESVFEQGRPVQINYNNQSTVRTRGNERMVAMLDNGIRKVYPDVTRPEEFDHFYEKYAKGCWLTMKVRIVSVDVLPAKEPATTVPAGKVEQILVALSKLAHKESTEKEN